MMYPFMTLDDDTEIVHSDMQADGSVKVYIDVYKRQVGSSGSPAHPWTEYVPGQSGRYLPSASGQSPLAYHRISTVLK